MTEMSETTENKSKETSTHPDDFFQKVLGSFKPDEFSDEDIAIRKKRWQSYEDPEEQEFEVNDFPEYFYAGFWIRLWAFLIDLLCISAITKGSIRFLFHVLGLNVSNQAFSLYGICSLAIYLGYFACLTKMNHGQTIGKMIFGIRVVCVTEEELSWQTVITREVAGRFILQLHPLTSFGYLIAAFTNRKQHVVDYFADTSVVTINTIKAFNKEVQA